MTTDSSLDARADDVSESIVSELVDLDRYPLFDLHGEQARTLIDDAKRQLEAAGYVELPGFVKASAVETLVEDAESLAGRAYKSKGIGTAYLETPPSELAADHPRRWKGPYSVGAVSYDLIPESSPLRRLYESELLKELVSLVMGGGDLYRYGDPFGALNLAVMGEADELQWHFDQTDFVVSLAIQSATTGGDFEVAPFVRRTDDEAYEDVRAVLDGTARSSELVRTIPMTPGTLLIFMGRHSVHRVSPISGPVLRHVGLLAYDRSEGSVGSDLLRTNRYGRTVAFDRPPKTWPVEREAETG